MHICALSARDGMTAADTAWQAIDHFNRVLAMQRDNGEVWSALGMRLAVIQVTILSSPQDTAT
jgi:hypothetical protein